MVDNTGGQNEAQAVARGFTPVSLLNPLPIIRQAERKYRHIRWPGSTNPWNKPPFFERIIRRNINQKPSTGTYVQDIEFDFEEDVAKAWSDKTVRDASGAKDLATFEAAYFREWASWFWLPLKD